MRTTFRFRRLFLSISPSLSPPPGLRYKVQIFFSACIIVHNMSVLFVFLFFLSFKHGSILALVNPPPLKRPFFLSLSPLSLFFRHHPRSGPRARHFPPSFLIFFFSFLFFFFLGLIGVYAKKARIVCDVSCRVVPCRAASCLCWDVWIDGLEL